MKDRIKQTSKRNWKTGSEGDYPEYKQKKTGRNEKESKKIKA